MNKLHAYFAFQDSDSYLQRHITFLIALMTFHFLAAYFMLYAIRRLLRTFLFIALFLSGSGPVNIPRPHSFIPLTVFTRFLCYSSTYPRPHS